MQGSSNKMVSTLRSHSYHNRGNIIGSTGGVGSGDQLLDALFGLVGFDNLQHLLIFYQAAEAIGAEDQGIALGNRFLKDIYLNLRLCAQGTVDHVALLVVIGLLRRD